MYARIVINVDLVIIFIVADHSGLLPKDLHFGNFFLRIALVDEIRVLESATGLSARIGIKHDLIACVHHKAVGRSCKNTIIAILRFQIQGDIVIVVAAHIIVIGIIGSKIDGVKEVGAIGARCHKQLHI